MERERMPGKIKFITRGNPGRLAGRLDWRIDYHIIKNSCGAATTGSRGGR
jgi:hypothetical protein